MTFYPTALRFSLIALLLAAVVTAQAAPGAKKAAVESGGAAPAGDVGPEAGLLKQAYASMEVADHDYKGHRKNAMKQVEDACKLLGTDIKGGGKGHEAQGVSDMQLRNAAGLLQQARALAIAGNQPKVTDHIDNALKQINIALGIK